MREERGDEVFGVGPPELAIVDPGSSFEIVFGPVTIARTPVCYEHTAVVWTPLSAALSLLLVPSDRRFVEALLARAASEKRPAGA